ncbi:MAG: hypothetical protein A3B74_01310 [Candidatus Kerfeldbacteria bacterium RIFCSPHIGHO2_02_FULL_42_14]|uniref:Uncharacterized protein n=1 Tax=Candidatus Kerfeldbacteria bacterium RIFCSPHIGHO2_02_FULL_42_14 TaxID=1798540 RepID=A0A1G2ARD9_9BACT|nr:MAG: hypothetical protein A3B74_01310 [Candidatus Kerfeldbacteria bacterium RIFCSPHIGHO2_02_FULL_42_14]OGY81198.1 MAG: hypothetical protein A3E60_02825 [Candidatus Kerfeldbacteria bacterium RIFCSPHIGHO2_12_FULL_42_13]OGY83382.1 MAG: hypothetical protein A3I91_01885 [Candidatus Kerfeldbacteria bacterium RIFCSPLOWO2_02_FULL_42_19]OGY85495.1 MAG: hypothetical protein A3G01_03620 [Candidatus Kerfeldbacteria bacterium RIFCSPLOWO2_12_FULL_43_9]
MDLFIEISLIIVLAAFIAGLAHLLKQPLIIGYILTGLLVGPKVLNLLRASDVIHIFSQIGIALLLFIVGLGLRPKNIRRLGNVAVITGVGQVLFTSLIGFAIVRLFGFNATTSLYIAIALTFSSTIIILKLLSDKRHLGTLYGQISIGFLLVQDIIATLILIFVSSFSEGQRFMEVALLLLLKGVLLGSVLYFCTRYVLPPLSFFFARKQEFLFLFSIAWGLGLASLFHLLGFSIEIGALVAGVALSTTPYHLNISFKMRPVRDFFVILFFILLGSELVFESLLDMLLPAFILSVFVLIGNPLIVMTLLGLLGYSKRTGFMAGLTVAQISEFSLILMALGSDLGHISQDAVALVTVVGLVTIAGSTYLILYAEKIYPYLAPYLSLFEKKHRKAEQHVAQYDMFLFGYNRVGYDFVQVFRDLKKKFLVVDFDPEAVQRLSHSNIPVKYGDVGDSEFLAELDLEHAILVVSTIPDFETNAFLVQRIRSVNSRAIVIVISHNISCAQQLYDFGASYVMMPHFLGAQYAAMMIERYGFDVQRFHKERTEHRSYLRQRQVLGHEHPVAESLR